MGTRVKQECLTLYPEIEEISENLTDVQLGKLIRALIRYRYRGEVPDFKRGQVLSFIFPLLKNQVDRMEKVKQRNAENARRRWEKAEASEETEAPEPANMASDQEPFTPF